VNRCKLLKLRWRRSKDHATLGEVYIFGLAKNLKNKIEKLCFRTEHFVVIINLLGTYYLHRGLPQPLLLLFRIKIYKQLNKNISPRNDVQIQK
jgi:hypothetical protein